MTEPELAVVVATRGRPLRLRWLLNALTEQTLPRGRFEVVIAHNADDPATAAVLRGRDDIRVVVADGGPAALRNAGWRSSAASHVAFTDDDCRPPSDWAANALAAARAHPDAVVQGATQPDPDELGIYQRAPHARSQEIHPPHPMAQTCNIVYPRELLERLDGFDESFPQAVGEDTDLALRAQDAGAELIGAPDVLTYHAVEWGLPRKLRGTWRWQHVALVVRKHPALRRELPLGGWAWKARHAYLAVALLGAVVFRRAPLLAVLAALPYVVAASPRRYGSGPRALARDVAEMPGRALVDAVELAALLRGSARHRALLL